MTDKFLTIKECVDYSHKINNPISRNGIWKRCKKWQHEKQPFVKREIQAGKLVWILEENFIKGFWENRK